MRGRTDLGGAQTMHVPIRAGPCKRTERGGAQQRGRPRRQSTGKLLSSLRDELQQHELSRQKPSTTTHQVSCSGMHKEHALQWHLQHRSLAKAVQWCRKHPWLPLRMLTFQVTCKRWTLCACLIVKLKLFKLVVHPDPVAVNKAGQLQVQVILILPEACRYEQVKVILILPEACRYEQESGGFGQGMGGCKGMCRLAVAGVRDPGCPRGLPHSHCPSCQLTESADSVQRVLTC